MNDILVKSSYPSTTEITLYDFAEMQRDMQQRYIGMLTDPFILNGNGSVKTKRQALLFDEIKRIEVWLKHNHDAIEESRNHKFISNMTIKEYLQLQNND